MSFPRSRVEQARRGGLGCLRKHGPEFFRRLRLAQTGRLDPGLSDPGLSDAAIRLRVAVARKMKAEAHGLDLDGTELERRCALEGVGDVER